ncbi:MAG: flagellar motor switch protein FliG [Verrucomicrobia bacterium]|nr:flagellar motor switch protein FliG [Verrucomicrobiota bacterium]
MPDPSQINAAAAQVARMSNGQKLAVLLTMLGPESAAQILKNLEEQEMQAVSAEMAKLGLIPQDVQREILREFSEVAVQASTGVLGGVDFTTTALEKSVGQFRAAEIVARVAPKPAPTATLHQFAEMDVRQIYNLIRDEQSQTVALILSYLPPDKASNLFLMLRAEVRDAVVERLATLGPTPVEVVEQVVSVLQRKLGANPTRALNQTGGVKQAAGLLNIIDRNLSKSLLVTLEERNPDLVAAIRQAMFTFEDLVRLDKPSLQKIMREIETRDLAMALKTASEALKIKLLGCLSRRAAEGIAEEIAYLPPLKPRETQAVQLRIIEVVRRLEGEGEIDLSEATNPHANEVLA